MDDNDALARAWMLRPKEIEFTPEILERIHQLLGTDDYWELIGKALDAPDALILQIAGLYMPRTSLDDLVDVRLERPFIVEALRRC